MKHVKRILLVFFVLSYSLVFSQTTLKRYKRLVPPVVNNKLVTMTTIPNKISANAEESPAVFKSVFDLQTDGQESALTGRTPAEIEDLLNKKFQKPEKDSKSYVASNIKTVRLTFSIKRNVDYNETDDKFNAYDRIEMLNYKFKLSPDFTNKESNQKEVTFEKWNKYITEYGTLDIGTIEFNRSFTATLSGGNSVEATVGNQGGSKDLNAEGDEITKGNSTGTKTTTGISGSVGYGNSKKENQNIKSRYIQLTGTLKDDEFEILQQGTREIDLTGNVSIDLTVKLPIDDIYFATFTNLFDDESLPNPVAKAKMSIKLHRIPDRSMLEKGLYGQLDYSYTVRHIVKKANTSYEYDDVVQFISGKATDAKATIIHKSDLDTPVYFLSIKYQDGKERPLTFKHNTKNLTIDFKNYMEALDFQTWLLNTLDTAFTGDLKISGRLIQFDDIKIDNQWIKDNIKSIYIKKLD